MEDLRQCNESSSTTASHGVPVGEAENSYCWNLPSYVAPRGLKCFEAEKSSGVSEKGKGRLEAIFLFLNGEELLVDTITSWQP